MATKYLKKIGPQAWEYRPPAKYLKTGIVSSFVHSDRRKARKQALACNELIEQYDAGLLVVDTLTTTSTFQQVVTNYLSSDKYSFVHPAQQGKYKQFFSELVSLKVTPTKELGSFKVNELTFSLCERVYAELRKTLTEAGARKRTTAFSLLMNFLKRLDLVKGNPMAAVKFEPYTRKVRTWTKEQVETLLSVAFTEYKWRSVGLICLLCYEWSQHPVDIRNLTWDNINFEAGHATILQCRTKTTVYPPIDDDLKKILLEQKKLTGHQEYVCPHYSQQKEFVLLNKARMDQLFREVREKAGLPKKLKLGSLRSTAILEAVEAGADLMELHHISGLTRVNNIQRYFSTSPEANRKAYIKRKNK